MSEQRKQAGWNLDNSYASLPPIFYTIIEPNPVRSPKLAILNESLVAELGLDANLMKSEQSLQILAGNKAPKGSEPLAQAYAGHQFGNFTMLGDGRALLYGEQITPNGVRLDIQLKGSGRTPYSRGGDGRAGLGPMLREYIISEAMHGLGIPTTRSLSVVTTGEAIVRETKQPGALMARIASSHIRVGTFQFAANMGEYEDLQALADYTINRHYPELKDKENKYLLLLEEVVKRQAALISQWQLVGFIHGVMNTDNMSISGETIDYGPCAFMDTYDMKTVFSSIDTQGRYAYGNQPGIGGWNLARLAESLLPLLHEEQEEAIRQAQEVLSAYPEYFQANYLNGMRVKLGLFNKKGEDLSLIHELLELIEKYNADYTNTFRALTMEKLEENELFKSDKFAQWQTKWSERLEKQQESKHESIELMKQHNPTIIPRNHRVEEALDAAVEKGDYHVMEKLLAALKNPYDYSADNLEYTELPPKTSGGYQTYCGT
ncbi:protein adenylyltransferase SelO [Psychrobacillus sp. NPDC093200]|uniref:protein adenylyltransferase SelO n=1 Tax=Psychrobacillus sp. NPDC093200 TaxID=3390656 RepID=UPI003D06A7A1